MTQQRKFTIIFCISSLILVGCNSIAPSNTSSPPQASTLNDNITVYSTRTHVAEWFKSGNWEKINYINGIPVSSSYQETTDFNPADSSAVILGESKTPAKIIAQGNSFHQKLKILKLTDNPQNILTIDGTGNSDFRIEYLELKAGQIVIKNGTLFLDSGKIDKGTIISGNPIQFQKFPNSTIGSPLFEMSGGKFDMNISIPDDFTLTGYGDITGTLTNAYKGTLLLRNIGTLNVKSFTNRGTIRADLTNNAFTSPLLISAGMISLNGRLEVIGGAGKTYTLFKGSSITGVLITPSNVVVTRSPTEYKITVDKFSVAKRSSYSFMKPYLNSLKSDMSFTHNLQTMHIKNGLSFASKTQQSHSLLTLNQSYKSGHIGFYTGHGNGNTSTGIYQTNTCEKINLTHSLHIGESLEQGYFAAYRAELSLNLILANLNLFPKILTEFSDFKEYNTLSNGIGLDLTSKFKIYSAPCEAFASFNVIHAKDQSINSEYSIGFQSEFGSCSHIYVSIANQNMIELGINMKL